MLVTDNTVIQLSETCKDLRTLVLFGCYGITNSAVTSLSKCSKLEKLSVGGCKNITDYGILPISTNCTNLQSLDLFSTKIGDTTLQNFPISPGLHVLELARDTITDVSVLEIANKFRNLRQLSLFCCTDVSSEAVKKLFKELVNLQILDLSECAKIDDSAFDIDLPNFESLNLMRIFNITDKTIFQICNFCSNLKNLNLRTCNKLTEKSIAFLPKACPRLRTVNVKEIQIAASVLHQIKQTYPHLGIHGD